MFTGVDVVVVRVTIPAKVVVGLSLVEPMLDKVGNVRVNAEPQVLSSVGKLLVESVTVFIVFVVALTGVIFSHSSQLAAPVLHEVVQKVTRHKILSIL